MEVPMEYKLSSFNFSSDISRDDKHHVIKRINSIRSKCPSDSNFTGSFSHQDNIFSGEIKVLFSKGTFFVQAKGSNIPELVQTLLNLLEDQVACWKTVRFDQPETFIDYNEYLSRQGATGS
jgi:hypothetical protein